ncbi:hypothetical protein VT84_33575 [Gemmata sp. SH-PL17]|nr:hypothetical protein [Gemmata sp. SH-PL17]AMV29374.1 hypothetical protein VT84_33575 [Gemmata sp. SH-PL17]
MRRRLVGFVLFGMVLVVVAWVLREIGWHRVAATDVEPMPFEYRG